MVRIYEASSETVDIRLVTRLLRVDSTPESNIDRELRLKTLRPFQTCGT